MVIFNHTASNAIQDMKRPCKFKVFQLHRFGLFHRGKQPWISRFASASSSSANNRACTGEVECRPHTLVCTTGGVFRSRASEYLLGLLLRKRWEHPFNKKTLWRERLVCQVPWKAAYSLVDVGEFTLHPLIYTQLDSYSTQNIDRKASRKKPPLAEHLSQWGHIRNSKFELSSLCPMLG